MERGRKERVRSKAAKSEALLAKSVPFMKALRPYVFSAVNTDWSFVTEENRTPVKIIAARIGNCASAFLQLHSVYSDMALTLEIAKRYPWRKGQPISRAQHLGFAWFQHVNLCYMFRERYKISSNLTNDLMEMFQKPFRVDVGSGLKNIDRGIGAFIKSRGRHVHEWDNNHEHIKFFSVIEFVHQHDPAYSGARNIKSEYWMAKYFLVSDIKDVLSFMEGFLSECFDGYISEVVKLAGYFDDVLDKIKGGAEVQIVMNQGRK